MFHGKNGSGKTTVLECLYYICCLRSFRSPSNSNLINSEEDSFLLRGLSSVSFNRTDSEEFAIGCEVGRRGKAPKIKVNGEVVRSASQIASIQPVVYISPTSTELIDGSPKLRRNFIDWLVFHVEPSYSKLKSEFNIALTSRNKLLRDFDKVQEEYWRNKLSLLSEEILRLRRNAFEKFLPIFNRYTELFFEDIDSFVALKLKHGWDISEANLSILLERNLESDLNRGYTQLGPHTMDVGITSATNSGKIHYSLSRGQQRLVTLAMNLAQVEYLNELGKDCVLLVDDLNAELDDKSVEKTLKVIQDLDVQTFITTIHQGLLNRNHSVFNNNYKMFHVEQGHVIEEK